jgi:hypothetical protein
MATVPITNPPQKRRKRGLVACSTKFILVPALVVLIFSSWWIDMTMMRSNNVSGGSVVVTKYAVDNEVETNNTSGSLPSIVTPVNDDIPIKNTTHPILAKQKRELDFIIAGFPKCGTTTLLYALKAHNETDISSDERCAVADGGLSDDQALEVLNDSAAELSSSPHIKLGIKCPNILESYETIARIELHSPKAKFVIGMRHPIDMLESFYNYRVTEIYDHKLQEPIPSFEDVIRCSEPWKGVSRDIPRFDRDLMQFGKTRMAEAGLEHLVGLKDMAVSKAKVFLYTLDQLNESSVRRSKPFRRDLQTFLGLEKPLEPLGHENLNSFVGKEAYPETVDLCEDTHSSLRKELLARGKQMASWIRDEFMQSPDVTVGNANQFLKSLASWSVDPCELRRAET